VYLVALLVWILEIDPVDLEEGKIALALFGAADLALDGIARAQRKAPE